MQVKLLICLLLSVGPTLQAAPENTDQPERSVDRATGTSDTSDETQYSTNEPESAPEQPRWDLYQGFTSPHPPTPAALEPSETLQYFLEIQDIAEKCAREKVSEIQAMNKVSSRNYGPHSSKTIQLHCWEKALPKKCRTLVYRNTESLSSSKRSWFNCASSCVDAGLYSRNFGECSRQSK